jgi:hypothetical protein
MQKQSGKSELFFPILVRKNRKEQSRSRVNFYIYTPLFWAKNTKKGHFSGLFFREKSIYASKKRVSELLGHYLTTVRGN